MSKEKSKLSLAAKAKKFDVPLGVLKKVFRRGVAAWNSGHRPGTTPQQWGHARVNSYLRKGKTYHTADSDLHEQTQQLNELSPQTYTNYIDATYGDSPAAEARKLGKAKNAKKIIGRVRARKLRAQQQNSPEKIAARAAEYRKNNPQVVGSRFDEEKKITGTNCKNCVFWVKESEKPVDKSELNENGGLKAPNEAYVKMSKHVDLVTLPGKATVKTKAYCNNDEINDFVTERMCCAYWDGEGTKREYKGEADILDEDLKQLFSLDPQKNQSLKQTGVETALSFIPGVGQALAARDFERARRAGDKAGMAMAAASVLPVGRLAKNAGNIRKIFVPATKEAQAAHIALEKAGKSGEEIWHSTRNLPGGATYRNPAGEIRQEISDDLIALQKTAPSSIKNIPGKQAAVQTYSGKAADVVKHDELYRRHPELAQYGTNVEVYKSTDPKKSVNLSGMLGKFDPSKKEVLARGGGEKSALSTFVHEIQHAVQRATGGAGGSNPAYEKTKLGFFDKIFGGDKKAYERYKENPGEVEARAAQARMDLTPKQRQERFPGLDFETGKVTTKPAAAPKPTPAAAPKPAAVKPAPAPAPLPQRAKGSGYESTPSTPPKPVKLTAESVNDLFEMQLIGTDEYRQHAIAMTPGQFQEIEDALPFEEYGIQDYTPEEDQSSEDSESNGTVESGDSRPLPMSFRQIRKRFQEEAQSEEEESEDEEDELENDGAEDGVDFTPNLKMKKIRNTGPNDYTKADSSGLPVLSTSMISEETINEALQYHFDNNISLVENVYRPGSEMFFEMLHEAKRLYSEGSYTPKDEYEQDLLESDIGEVAEYEGQPVILDFPFEEELNEDSDPTKGRGIGKPFRSGNGGAVYVRNGKGNVIKVNFSHSGMKKRYNEPARVKSFMARHHCLTNKDRTSASYWACRWPRYFSNSGQRWW